MKERAAVGFIKNAKANAMARDAAEAFAAGDLFFTPIMTMPTFSSGLSANVVDVAMMMESIVSAGWKLHTWAVCTDRNGHPQAMPLFVRP